MHVTNKTSEARTEKINHNYEAIIYQCQNLFDKIYTISSLLAILIKNRK